MGGKDMSYVNRHRVRVRAKIDCLRLRKYIHHQMGWLSPLHHIAYITIDRIQTEHNNFDVQHLVLRPRKKIYLFPLTRPTLFFLPPTLKFVLIFLKKKNIFVNKLSKIQSVVNFNVQFNVTNQYTLYSSPLMVINVSKVPSRLMEVKINKVLPTYRPYFLQSRYRKHVIYFSRP